MVFKTFKISLNLCKNKTAKFVKKPIENFLGITLILYLSSLYVSK